MEKSILDKYEMTIGIECHVQLKTKTKLFSASDNDARDKAPNTAVSPIDFALPGMLPVLNKEAVRLAVIAAKALNSKVANVSSFDRKHYFYPDLPKGYQTSQMYQPTILAGEVTVPKEDGSEFKVRINHAHIEEDAGKLSHSDNGSYVDLNRAGTPLIEIVSEPDMHSALEAKAYATELYRLMTFADVTHGDLYQGNMRFDVNISVAPKGSNTLGTRAEIKNLNSFRNVERAAEYEFKRQVELVENGEKVKQETRGWDDNKQATFSQRSKEDAQDYRYMPDADIPPIVLTDERILEIQKDCPILPPAYREKWQDLKLDKSVIDVLFSSSKYAKLVSEVLDKDGKDSAKKTAFWFASALSGSEEDSNNEELTHLSADNLIQLAHMVSEGLLSSTNAKEVFIKMLSENKTPEKIAKENNLIQVSDTSAIEKILDEVLSDESSQKAINDIKNGNEKVYGFLVGQVMKKSQGKANPGLVQKMLREKIAKL